MTTPTVASIRASPGESADGASIRHRLRHLRLHSVQVRVIDSIWGI